MSSLILKRFGLVYIAMVLASHFRFVTGEKSAHGSTSHKLTRTGLGSKIHLIDLIDNPFLSDTRLNILESVPSRFDESLTQEPVPPEFRNREEFAQFSLGSSALLQVQETSGEIREVVALNAQVGRQLREQKASVAHHRVHVKNARDEVYSGPSSVDFSGACVEGYVPFEGVSASASLDDCWASCRGNFACTQVHYDSVASSCIFSHGISTRASGVVDTTTTCRSLTPAGVSTLNQQIPSRVLPIGLPPFQVLANSRVMLVYNQTRNFLANSLAECQSGCLQFDDCSFGVWLDTAPSACQLGFDIVPVETTVCPQGSLCTRVCGTQDCILFERNVGNLVNVPGLQSLRSSALIPTSASLSLGGSLSASCNTICATDGSPDICETICLADKRARCQASCVSEPSCVAVGFQYGVNEQVCTGYTSIPNANMTIYNTTTTELVNVFVLPKFAIGSIPTGSFVNGGVARRTLHKKTHFLTPTDVRPTFTTFDGACLVFSEGGLMGPGVGLSQFAAQSLDECWNLCENWITNNDGQVPQLVCSQVHFYPSSQQCVLGDAISTKMQRNSVNSVICRSLNYLPAQSYNGLIGMLFVDTVSFSNVGPATSVDSLEECQAMCKVADAGATDSACLFGSFVACSSFYSTKCFGENLVHPDCQTCASNSLGGVCHLAAVDTPATANPPCLGSCVLFEHSALGYSLEIKTDENDGLVDHTVRGGLVCDNPTYLPPATPTVDGDCFYPVASMWHCHELCSAVNRSNGSSKCIGGLYTDDSGTKECRLSTQKSAVGAACGAANCAWFELAGLGHTAGLELTGMNLAATARDLSVLPFIIGKGHCAQFKALDASVTVTPSQLSVSPIQDCTAACAYFPQCMSFQVAGSLSGGEGGYCDVTQLDKSSDCTFITCTMSSALTLPVPADQNNNSTVCYSKTPSGTVENGPASIDMGNVDPGIPGFIVMNARVRKFGFANVSNKQNLALVPTMEECQSLCRTTASCKTGSWQPCKAIEQYCPPVAADGDSAIVSPVAVSEEHSATCNVCRNVNISESQPSVQFPANLGVCKLADKVALHSEACSPDPCYAFEAGLDDFYILSMTHSSMLKPDGSVDQTLLNFQGTPGAYFKTISLEECESYCDIDFACKYGHFAPRTVGYGECYLTGQEIRVGSDVKQLKTPTKCTGTCIVFMKLPSKLDPSR